MEGSKVIVVSISGSKHAVTADGVVVDEKSRVVLAVQGKQIVGIFPCENIQAAYVEPSDSKPRS